jgi:lysophospholipase L1-like esterase
MDESSSRERGRQAVLGFTFGVFLLFLAEGVAQVVVHARTNAWPIADRNEEVFQRHPWLVGAPRPGAVVDRDGVVISIDSLGFRGKDFPLVKPDSVLRVLALGGSDTFGVGVTDSATWPAKLEFRLDAALSQSGGRYRRAEVINAGVPGYSTLENLITFESRGVFLRPDVVVMYQGINDMRSGHSPGFRTDYSNFHAPTQVGNLVLNVLRRGNRSGLIRLGVTLVSHVFQQPAPRDSISPRVGGVDERARQVFESNLRAFAALCHGFGVPCLLVPQLVTQSHPPDEYWLRYLDTRTLPVVVAAYDSTMAAVAKSTDVRFAQSVLDSAWVPEDFHDWVHLSNQGGAKFASILAADILAIQPAGSAHTKPNS